ncbi:HAD family hydrolase [Rickettsiales bacterium LUAb2]
MQYKLIIFDLDGVLVNTEEFYLNGVISAFKNQGFNFSIQHCKENFAGVAIPLLIERFNNNNTTKIDSAKFIKNIHDYGKAFQDHVTIMKGAKEFISSLRIPFCVASASSISRINEALDIVGLLKYFKPNQIFSCDTYKKYKPEPDVYINASKSMGFLPNDCIAIEDSIPGVRAAKGAKLDVIGLLAADYIQEIKVSHKQLLLDNGATTTKDSFAEIAKFLF